MSEPIKSVEEFIAWTKQLDGQLLLYRGLADADWGVESSAYRRIRVSQEEPLPVTFQNYIKQLLDNAGLQGFRYQHDRALSDLELLAELQHYGAATCLIDFTENALIALWFACREELQKDGKVVAMATDDIACYGFSEQGQTVEMDAQQPEQPHRCSTVGFCIRRRDDKRKLVQVQENSDRRRS